MKNRIVTVEIDFHVHNPAVTFYRNDMTDRTYIAAGNSSLSRLIVALCRRLLPEQEPTWEE